MSTVLEASVPAAQFALQETAERVPDASFEAVRVAVDATGDAMALLWSYGADPTATTEALEADESTDAVAVVTRFHEASLYRLSWTTRVRIVLDLLLAPRGTVISARARAGTWTFRVLFPERAAVAAVVEECERYGVDLRVERIYPVTESSRVGRSDLTDEQFRTVQTAHERGYYDVPRRTTLTELSDELGVSHQALSERLRRGHRRLIERALGNRLRFESRS